MQRIGRLVGRGKVGVPRPGCKAQPTQLEHRRSRHHEPPLPDTDLPLIACSNVPSNTMLESDSAVFAKYLFRTQCHLACFSYAAMSVFALVMAGLTSLMVAGASCLVPCWPGFLTR